MLNLSNPSSFKNPKTTREQMGRIGNLENQSSLESTLHKDEKKTLAMNIKITVLRRILATLLENGGINRTNLAGKTGLNYSNCIKYVNLLQLLGWVEIIYNNGHYVAITEKGIETIERFADL